MDSKFKIGDKITLSREYVREITMSKDEGFRTWFAYVLGSFTGTVTGIFPDFVSIQDQSGIEVEVAEKYIEHYIPIKTVPTSERAAASGIKLLHVNMNAIMPCKATPNLTLHQGKKTDNEKPKTH